MSVQMREPLTVKATLVTATLSTALAVIVVLAFLLRTIPFAGELMETVGGVLSILEIGLLTFTVKAKEELSNRPHCFGLPNQSAFLHRN